MNFKWEIDKRSECPALSYLTMQHATVLGNPSTRRMGHLPAGPLSPPLSPPPPLLSPPPTWKPNRPQVPCSFLSSRPLFLLPNGCQPPPPTSQGPSAEAGVWGTHLQRNAFLSLSFLRINSANKMSKTSERLEMMSGLLLFLKTSILMKCI